MHTTQRKYRAGFDRRTAFQQELVTLRAPEPALKVGRNMAELSSGAQKSRLGPFRGPSITNV